MESRILGVDCGNTIFHYLTGKPIEGALEGIEHIVRSGHFDKVYLISKIDPVSQRLYLLNLRRLGFWRRTNIPRGNIRFCRRHGDKAAICDELGITHFVDDRFEVLSHLATVPYRYAFNPRPREMQRYPDMSTQVRTAHSWPALTQTLLRES